MSDFNTRFDFFIGLTTQTGNQLDVLDVVQDHVVPVLASYGIDGFTATESVGYWRGQREACLIVTVFYPDQVSSWQHGAAFQFARQLDQEAVLVSTTRVYADLIGGVQ